MVRKLLLTVLVLFFLASSTSAQNGIIRTAEEYILTQFEVMLQKDASLLDSYFESSDPISKDTLAYQKGRLMYYYLGWQEWGSDVTWYSKKIESAVVESTNSRAIVKLKFLGQIKMKDTGDDLHNWNHSEREITLIRKGEGWYVQEDIYDDQFVKAFGRENIEFDYLIIETINDIREQKGLPLIDSLPKDKSPHEGPTEEKPKAQVSIGFVLLTIGLLSIGGLWIIRKK